MKIKMLVLAVIALCLVYSSTNVFSYEEALGFKYPLDNWEVGCNNFWSNCNQPRHLGDDATVNVGTFVYAPADGIIKHAQNHPYKDGVKNYGGLIIIEHFIKGEYVCSVLGHLKPEFTVSEGEKVSAGQRLGFVGTKEENGGYDPHLHYGIRKGQYGTGTGSDCGKWIFAGYAGCDSTKDKWYDPSKFVSDHPYMVGYFPDGFHVDGTSQSFLTAYQSFGGFDKLGFPWSNPCKGCPNTQYVHNWPDDGSFSPALLVQDFISS